MRDVNSDYCSGKGRKKWASMRKFTKAISGNMMGSSSVVGRRKYNCIVNPLSAGSVIISHNDDIIHCSK